MARYTKFRLAKGAEGRFYLHKKGVEELLKSSEMREVIEEQAVSRRAMAGPGYEYAIHEFDDRVGANIYPDTYEARKDNYENNTLLKVIGS